MKPYMCESLREYQRKHRQVSADFYRWLRRIDPPGARRLYKINRLAGMRFEDFQIYGIPTDYSGDRAAIRAVLQREPSYPALGAS